MTAPRDDATLAAMTTMIAELYNALLAAGSPEDKLHKVTPVLDWASR